MNVEIRHIGGRKKYYLAHSYRIGAKVRKLRSYLGADLSKEELEAARVDAETSLKQKIPLIRAMRDPYLTILTAKEKKDLKSLEPDNEIKIIQLSEAEWQKFTELFTYNTNAIEGSKLEKKEVKDLLEKNRLPNRTSEDISETFGVAEAVKYVRATEDPISIDLIKTLHWIVFKNSKSYAGQLRGKGIEVGIYDSFGNIVHRGATSTKVPLLLKKLVDWYKNNRKRYPPIVLAAVVHNQFENIHPFEDGNGRVGRLLLISILLKNGLPPVNIELDVRNEYYTALQVYEKTGNIRPTMELILKEYRRLKGALKR
jgi:Fic family protein